jgi:hypothetical protein
MQEKHNHPPKHTNDTTSVLQKVPIEWVASLVEQLDSVTFNPRTAFMHSTLSVSRNDTDRQRHTYIHVCGHYGHYDLLVMIAK